jgi:putative membrane protein
MERPDADETPALLRLVPRALLGGTLMGLANLVPGISGGTMLLAAGIYPAFIAAIAEVTTLRFRRHSLVLLGLVVGAAGAAVLLLAGATRSLVIEQRWIMYSLFIGLTVPIVWRLARPASPSTWAGAAVGFAVMVAMALGDSGRSGNEASTGLLVLSGMAGAGAMILPGISGGYLLLLLGQYLPILGAIDQAKQALLGPAAPDMALLFEALAIAIPVGIGVLVGIVGISNLLRWTLDRFPKPTLGLLLGLLVGAVAGLWPFQQGVAPEAGDVVKGRVLSEADLGDVDAEDWRGERFTPSGGQVGGSVALVLLGFGVTLLIDRVGSSGDPSPSQSG